MLCRAQPGENGGILSTFAERECRRQLARREHSRFTILVQHGAGHRPTDQRGYSVSQQESWPKIAVVGAGAVGGYFGGLLARAGAPVTMIGRVPFVEAVEKNGLFLDTFQCQESVRVEASTELSAMHGAEIVLFCVKTTDNATTARALAPLGAARSMDQSPPARTSGKLSRRSFMKSLPWREPREFSRPAWKIPRRRWRAH